MGDTENTITQEMFDNNPTLGERGLKVGDALPATPALPGVASTPTAPENEKITMTKEELREFLGDFKKEVQEEVKAGFGKEIEELKKTNLMLVEIADVKNLENFNKRNRVQQGMFVRLSTYGGKVIIGWETVIDQVIQDTNTGRWTEKQIMRVKFEDDTTEDVDYRVFTDRLRLNQVTAKVLERTQIDSADPDVKKFRFKVRREDNQKEYEIMDTFVN